MDPRARRRATWALLAVVLLATSVGAVAVLRSTVQSGSIIINPGVILRPSQAWVDLGFASTQFFSNHVIVRATGVTLDNVSLDLQKLPAGVPRATMTITAWDPRADNRSTALEFIAVSGANTTFSFNVTGLRPDLLYSVSVDGVLQATENIQGGASLSWSDWLTSHTFDVAAYRQAPLPDTTPPARVTDLHAVEWGLDYAVLGWTAPGDNGTVGQASEYEARYGVGGAENATDFSNGTLIPTGTPLPAGSAETANVTGLSPGETYWFALRTADAVPNWSPVSDVLVVLTLTSLVGLPTVDSISLNAPSSQVEIVFSEPMNQTSVRQAINITPSVPFEVQWHDESHVTINLHAAMATNATYQLQVRPTAADAGGTPMARTFTFKFTGLAQPSQPSGPLGLPLVLLAPLLTVLVGLAVTTIVTAAWFRQTKRKVRALRGAVQALTRRRAEENLARQVRDQAQPILPSRGGSQHASRVRGKR